MSSSEYRRCLSSSGYQLWIPEIRLSISLLKFVTTSLQNHKLSLVVSRSRKELKHRFVDVYGCCQVQLTIIQPKAEKIARYAITLLNQRDRYGRKGSFLYKVFRKLESWRMGAKHKPHIVRIPLNEREIVKSPQEICWSLTCSGTWVVAFDTTVLGTQFVTPNDLLCSVRYRWHIVTFVHWYKERCRSSLAREKMPHSRSRLICCN